MTVASVLRALIRVHAATLHGPLPILADQQALGAAIEAGILAFTGLCGSFSILTDGRQVANAVLVLDEVLSAGTDIAVILENTALIHGAFVGVGVVLGTKVGVYTCAGRGPLSVFTDEFPTRAGVETCIFASTEFIGLFAVHAYIGVRTCPPCLWPLAEVASLFSIGSVVQTATRLSSCLPVFTHRLLDAAPLVDPTVARSTDLLLQADAIESALFYACRSLRALGILFYGRIRAAT